MQIVVCPSCAAQLLVSAERQPICGKCGRLLTGRERAPRKPFLERVSRWLGRFRRDAKEDMPSKASATAWATASPPAIVSQELKTKVDRLAKLAWGSREEINSRTLILNPLAIDGNSGHQAIVPELLKHVDRVAPALSVPRMTPRISTERLCEAAGQFVEQDGWVKIVVGASFFDNMRAAKAILCHELCHYVLESNGIREQPTIENERMTDTAIFVFGLGDVFLAGHKGTTAQEYRAGHRLGYLNDHEYAFVDRYVRWLRTWDEFLRTAKGRRDDWNWDRSLR